MSSINEVEYEEQGCDYFFPLLVEVLVSRGRNLLNFWSLNLDKMKITANFTWEIANSSVIEIVTLTYKFSS